MSKIVDYSLVLSTLTSAGFESLYHNSGAFGLPRGAGVHHLGWVGPDDPTLRPAALSLVRRVAAPFAPTLASLAIRAWQSHLPGPAWLMPRNHWAFELDHANGDWMPAVLNRIGIDPAALAGRNDGTAIEFDANESALLAPVVEQLLTRLWGSDFALAWPGRPVLCTVHHHTQLWWSTTDPSILAALDRLIPR